MVLRAIWILCLLSVVLVLVSCSKNAIKLDGFPTEVKDQNFGYYGKEVLIDNNRVWMGAEADFIKSDCFTLMRVHSDDTTENYFSWTFGTPAALIGDKYVIAEQGILMDYTVTPAVLKVPPSDVAVVFRKNGQLHMYVVEEILPTNPPFDPIKDENDLCILKLTTPVETNCLDNIAPAVVSCDKEMIFNGDDSTKYSVKHKSVNVHNHHPVPDKGLLEHGGNKGNNNGWGNTNNGWGNVGSGWGHNNNQGWTAPTPPPPPQPTPKDCIYVSWGLKDETYMDAPTNITSTYSPVKIYNLDQCRDYYSQVNYYIDPYNREKFCIVNADDGNGPTCAYDYNGLTYCYFGDTTASRRRLLVGGMTNTQRLCPTKYPTVITRYAFYAELFARIGYTCCDPSAPTTCNCQSEYASLPKNIGPYFCPSLN